jgi:hypothetical protein
MGPGMNRRTFLKTTGVASAGLVLADFTRGKWKTKKPAFGVEG